jgi:hypothetical protein
MLKRKAPSRTTQSRSVNLRDTLGHFYKCMFWAKWRSALCTLPRYCCVTQTPFHPKKCMADSSRKLQCRQARVQAARIDQRGVCAGLYDAPLV